VCVEKIDRSHPHVVVGLRTVRPPCGCVAVRPLVMSEIGDRSSTTGSHRIHSVRRRLHVDVVERCCRMPDVLCNCTRAARLDYAVVFLVSPENGRDGLNVTQPHTRRQSSDTNGAIHSIYVMLENMSQPPDGFAHVARMDRVPRRFLPEYLPVVREFLPDGFVDIATLKCLLYHSTYSAANPVEVGMRNGFFHDISYSPDRDCWDRAGRYIQYPKIIRFYHELRVEYNAIPAHVRSSKDLEQFVPPPPGKRYLYCTRYDSTRAHRGLDKWEIHSGALDRLVTSVDELPDPRTSSSSVIVFVVDVADRYLAIDYRGIYNMDTLDPNTIVQRAHTSRSGEAFHTVVVPMDQTTTVEDQLAEFHASRRLTFEIGRTHVRAKYRGEASDVNPVSHVVHVETFDKSFWTSLTTKANHSLSQCCTSVRDHLRSEIALVTAGRAVTQTELERTFEAFLASHGRTNDSIVAVHVLDDGSVSLDLYWPVVSQTSAFVVALKSNTSFWGPAMFNRPSKATLLEFENHAFTRLPLWTIQREKRVNVAIGIPEHLEDVGTYLHVPPPLHPVTYNEAVAVVNGFDWLYPFQRETVVEMIARETAEDGFFGCFNTRVSGPPGGEGVFSISAPFTPTPRNDTFFAWVSPETSAGLFSRCGGILSDEPGMGKTRQILALIRALPKSLATLVIVKPAIFAQWKDEIDTVWPSCRLVLYHGTHKKRVNDLSQAALSSDIVLTTYSTFMSSKDAFEHAASVGWGRVVTDEGHDMSPRFAERFQYCFCPMWCVTATPQKKLRCIMQWLLGSAGGVIAGCATRGLSTRYCWDVWNWKQHGAAVLRVVMLRKTRMMCLELSEPVTKNVYIGLSAEERTVYEQVRASAEVASDHLSKLAVLRMVSMLIIVTSFGTFRTNEIRRSLSDASVATVSQFTDGDLGTPPVDDVCPICLDTLVDDPCLTGCGHWFCVECLQLHVSRTPGTTPTCPLCRMHIRSRSVLKRRRSERDIANVSTTGRPGTKILKILEDIRTILETPGRKIIVFFSNVSTIGWFEELVDEHLRLASPPLIVHGGVPLAKRQRNFHRFQTRRDDRLLLASIKTVSDGITLTAASDIMLVSPTGRNSVDEQVLGRANRIGRDLRVPVTLWRYIASNTVEERVYHQQQRWGRVALVNDLVAND